MKIRNRRLLKICFGNLLIIILLQFNQLQANTKSSFEPNNGLSSCSSFLIEQEDSLSLLGNYYHQLVLDYYGQEKYDSAIIIAELELKVWQNYKDVDLVILGKAYHNLGSFYGLTGNTIWAKKNLFSAIEIFRGVNLDRLLNSYIALSNMYLDEGAYQSAKYYCELIVHEARPFKKSTLIKAYNNLGSCMIELNQSDEFIKIQAAFRTELVNIDNAKSKIDYYNNAAVAYYKLGDYEEAILNYNLAIYILEKNEWTSALPNKYSQLGLCYLKLGKKLEALFNLERGLEYALNSKSKEKLALCYDNLGAYFLDVNDYRRALSFYQKSLKLLVPNFNPKTDFENPSIQDMELVINKLDLLIYLSDKAKTITFLNEHNFIKENALELYMMGDYLIDLIRGDHQSELTKLFWREQVRPFFEAAIALCYETNDLEKAFYFIEKSKAILLLEGIEKNSMMESLPNKTIQAYFDIKGQLTNFKEEYNISKINLKPDDLNELVRVKEKMNNFIDSLSVLYPNQFGMDYKTKVISLETFKNNAYSSPNSMYLNYFCGKNHIYVFGVQKDKYIFKKLGDTKEIESNIQKFLSFFEKATIIENNPTPFIQISNQLYEKILKPISNNKTEELIVFPDGLITRLSFDALVVDKNRTTLDKSIYLIDECITRYAFSASILFGVKDTIHYDQYKIAAFSPFLERDSSDVDRGDLLIYDELLSVKNKLNISYFNNKAASKANFIKVGKTHAAIHLSSHALCHVKENNPQIYFSDSALYFSELYSSAFPLDLVVLSACGTNVGQNHRGEGILSLARGFRYSGAKSIVSSLWNVQAASTASIMKAFYNGLSNGIVKHKALHLAKKSYLINPEIPSYEKSPYYWAGIIYYGSSNAIPLSNSSLDWLYWVLAIILISIVVFIRKKGHPFTKLNE